MCREIDEFSIALLKKLYLIEGVAIRILANSNVSEEAQALAKEIQELCAASPSVVDELFKEMASNHGVGNGKNS